ncbi:hypothetical protein [Staphylococcus xylosus]|uniref:hypothetical protein n=1 Tax=Staphylococcus xylosus TaxID=1288 RepID=UPI001CDC8956|nr:hypothetical protein [Staphylococcus xylosus]MCA2504034.1 hypothetical protein [Staphylococcus xylosus]MCE7781777.1 hypothetical protein [Staphylococcus xylosus]
MKSVFFLLFISLLVFSLFKLNNDMNNKRYKALLILSIVVLLITEQFFSFFCFIILLFVSIYLLIAKKNKQLWKRIILLLGIALIINIIIISIIASNTPSVTKDDIDNMSEKERQTYIYDEKDDNRDKKLYKEDKDTYKYLFKKYYNKDYDSVKIPNEKTINKIKDSDELSPEQSTKLEMEKPKLYDKYLDTVDTSFDEELDKEQDDSEDTGNDEDTLKESIDSELSNSHGSIDSVKYYNDSLGKNAVIVIKGEENLSDKMISEGMRYAVAETVKGVRDSNVSLDTFTIDVTYPVEDDMGSKNNDFHVIKSEWSMDNVKNMSDDQLELLNTDLDKFADSYNESTALR